MTEKKRQEALAALASAGAMVRVVEGRLDAAAIELGGRTSGGEALERLMEATESLKGVVSAIVVASTAARDLRDASDARHTCGGCGQLILDAQDHGDGCPTPEWEAE